LLATEGYVVSASTTAASANRSVAFKTALDRRMGTVEVEDQLLGASF